MNIHVVEQVLLWIMYLSGISFYVLLYKLKLPT